MEKIGSCSPMRTDKGRDRVQVDQRGHLLLFNSLIK
jgi:hypothetical protein